MAASIEAAREFRQEGALVGKEEAVHETSGKFTRAKKPEQGADLDAIFESIHWREFKILLKP